MGAGPLLTVSGGRGCACLPRQGATMRVRPPAHPGGGHSCRGPSLGRGAPDCPHNAVLTVASLLWAGPAWPYFLITFLAGPWELVARGAVGLTHAWVTWWRGEAAWSGVLLAREQVRMERD